MNEKRRIGEYPYSDYYIYGPVYHKKEKQNYILLRHKYNNRKTSISYARYLMSIKLKRTLDKSEEVDHIDNNKQNDSLENLQILSPLENKKKNPVIKTLINCVCANCNINFFKEKRQMKKTKNTFCSRSCNGKFQRNLNFKPKCKGVKNQ